MSGVSGLTTDTPPKVLGTTPLSSSLKSSLLQPCDRPRTMFHYRLFLLQLLATVRLLPSLVAPLAILVLYCRVATQFDCHRVVLHCRTLNTLVILSQVIIIVVVRPSPSDVALLNILSVLMQTCALLRTLFHYWVFFWLLMHDALLRLPPNNVPLRLFFYNWGAACQFDCYCCTILSDCVRLCSRTCPSELIYYISSSPTLPLCHSLLCHSLLCHSEALPLSRPCHFTHPLRYPHSYHSLSHSVTGSSHPPFHAMPADKLTPP